MILSRDNTVSKFRAVSDTVFRTMRVSRKSPVVKKAARIRKLLVPPIIKWVLNDNLCLLYAIWEMCTVAQKNILTVSQCHLFGTSNIHVLLLTVWNISFVVGRWTVLRRFFQENDENRCFSEDHYRDFVLGCQQLSTMVEFNVWEYWAGYEICLEKGPESWYQYKAYVYRCKCV